MDAATDSTRSAAGLIETEEFALTRAEFRALIRHLRYRRFFAAALTGAAFLAWMALSGGWPAAVTPVQGLAHLAPVYGIWVLGMFVGLPFLAAGLARNRSAYLRRRFSFGPDRFEMTVADGTHLTRPAGVLVRARRAGDLVLLTTSDGGMPLVVPRRAFRSEAELGELLARFADPSSVHAAAAAPARGWRALLRNLRAALRVMLFLPVGAGDFVPRGEQALALALVAVGGTVAASWVAAEQGSTFNEYGLAFYGFILFALLIGAFLVSRWHATVERLPLLLVVLAGLNLLFLLVQSPLNASLFTSHLTVRALFGWAVFLWGAAAWYRAVRLSFEGPRLKAFGSVALMMALGLFAEWSTGFDISYWEPPDKPEPQEARLDAEEIFYAQPERVDAAVDALKPQRPGVIDLYYVGFGSYAHQKVFSRELHHVQDELNAQFDTGGRSLLLLNSKETVNELPIASRSNLRRALRRLGQRMDRDEDVLLLYLTSHGSQRAELSVSLYPLALDTLDARYLRQSLDESGIRWRVIVISACYSGSFIDALKDDHTVVITAAAADRTSFGCSNELEYTYFGEAYFKEALGRTRSFIDAFDLARHAIERRERKEGLTPSKPMMYVGEAISDHLEQLALRLASSAPVTASGHWTDKPDSLAKAPSMPRQE